MVGLIEAIAKALVSHPEEVVVKTEGTEDNFVIMLSVAKDDMGKVIGKQGRIAKAIRSVLRAAAIKQNKSVTLEIVDE